MPRGRHYRLWPHRNRCVATQLSWHTTYCDLDLPMISGQVIELGFDSRTGDTGAGRELLALSTTGSFCGHRPSPLPSRFCAMIDNRRADATAQSAVRRAGAIAWVREHIFWDARVLSEVAIGEFLRWAGMQTPTLLRAALDTVHLIEHRRAHGDDGRLPTLCASGTAMGTYPDDTDEPGPIETEIPARSCFAVGCGRCGFEAIPGLRDENFGGGGFQFQWAGPWTKLSRVPALSFPNLWRAEIRRLVGGNIADCGKEVYEACCDEATRLS